MSNTSFLWSKHNILSNKQNKVLLPDFCTDNVVYTSILEYGAILNKQLQHTHMFTPVKSLSAGGPWVC